MKVSDWSIQVQDSWNQVKASSKRQDEAVQKSLDARDDEIRKMKFDRLKYGAIGLAAGVVIGFLGGVIAAN